MDTNYTDNRKLKGFEKIQYQKTVKETTAVKCKPTIF